MNQFKDTLNEAEEVALRKMIDNKPLMGGLKKALLAAIYQGTLEPGVEPEPRRNFVLQLLYQDPSLSADFNISDERLGQKTRASIEAIRMVEQGIAEIENLREPKEEKEEKKPNPGS